MTDEVTASGSNQGGRDAGKVVFVTGASSGIGAATALRLADAGHRVVLGARRRERLDGLVDRIRQDGGHADAVPLDVTSAEEVRAAVDGTVERHGRLDVFVANAGVMLLSRLDALLVQQWKHMVDVNVLGLLYGVAAVLPHFQRQQSGHLVTVASIGAHQVVGTSAVYSATKYAAWAVTEGLRLEADPSIRVTTVSPGVVETELAGHITDLHARELMHTYRRNAVPADAVAAAVQYAVDQPRGIDVNEIIVRPVEQR